MRIKRIISSHFSAWLILPLAALLGGCDALGGYSTKEISPKTDVYFDVPEFTVTDEAARQDGAGFEFATTHVFDPSQNFTLSDLAANINSYSSMEIRSLVLGDVSLKCTVDGAGSFVKELRLKAERGGGSETWETPAMDCTFGSPAGSAALKAFIQKVMEYNLYNRNVRVTVTGWTDAPAGSKINMRITAYFDRLKIRMYTGE